MHRAKEPERCALPRITHFDKRVMLLIDRDLLALKEVEYCLSAGKGTDKALCFAMDILEPRDLEDILNKEVNPV